MKIWGDKTEALLDVWSVQHFMTGILLGIVIGWLLKGPEDRKLIRVTLWVVLLAYLWEFLELNLENGNLGSSRVTYWFHGVEFLPNRLVMDPLLVTFGAIAGNKSKKLLKPAAIFTILWVLVSIFAFPHTMYLQEII